MVIPLLIAFYVLFPVLTIYLAGKYSIVDKIGPVIICYVAGIISGNIGIIPGGFFKTQDTIMGMTVAVALPLMFFSLDIRKWSRLAGKSILSFGLQIVAITIVSCAGYFIFRNFFGEETWKFAGMFIGVYTGGTVNLAAIKTALNADPTLYVAAHTSDVVVSSVYILFLITVAQRLFLKILPPFQPAGNGDSTTGMEDFSSYRGFFSRATIVPLAGALLLALVIVGVGGGVIPMLFPRSSEMVVAILSITTLGICCSFIPAVRNIKMSYQLGQYFILVFCLVVGSMADVSKLATSAPLMLVYVTYSICACLVLHVLLASLFRIDADTVIITSTAGINSPPLVPLVAAALKNKEIVISGVVTGIIGWVVGTYLGITVAYMIRGLGW